MSDSIRQQLLEVRLDKAVADGESGKTGRDRVDKVFRVHALANGDPELMETLMHPGVVAVELIPFGHFSERIILTGEQWYLTAAGGFGELARWRLYLPVTRTAKDPSRVAVVVMHNPATWRTS